MRQHHLNVLYFGNLSVRSRRGLPSPSTIVRCYNVSEELKRHDIKCKVVYNSLDQLGVNINAIRQSDAVIFHRIQTPLFRMPHVPLEVFLMLECSGSAKPFGFDFDDSIFLLYPILTELLIAKSSFVLAGSHFLFDFAKRWNKNVYLVPSAVDTEVFRPHETQKNPSRIVLGWHGSARVQFGYIKPLRAVLEQLAKKYDITFQLLGTLGSSAIQSYFSSIPGLKTEFGPDEWVPYSELPGLLANVDIGLSPLPLSIWTVGKCAMKALEYMAMEVPVVASAVGEHVHVVGDGTTGLLVRKESEWEEKLEMLIEDKGLRREMGRRGRTLVEEHFSLRAIGRRVSAILSSV